MIYIREQETKKAPGLTSLFIEAEFNPLILNVLRDIDCKVYDKKCKK